VNGLQTIASRNTHPLESAVVSVTQIHGGDTWNVIPETVMLRGTTRSFSPAAIKWSLGSAVSPTAPVAAMAPKWS
jgi:metal-dependent amidase/aminoacylase/carboxypeptidase family protein